LGMTPLLIGHGPTSGPIFIAEWVAAGAVVVVFGISLAVRWWRARAKRK